VSLLYISHHLDEIYEICDSVTVLRDGRLAHSGAVAGLTKPALVAAMVGESDGLEAVEGPSRSAQRSPVASSAGEHALRVEGLCVDAWCRDVSFSVRPGELVGLAGLAGSGNTQVAEVIVGLRRPHAGRVLLADRPVPPGDVRAAIAHGIGFVPKDRHADGLAPNLSVEENMTLRMLERLGPLGFVAPKARGRVAQRMMGSLEVVGSRQQLVSELSGGNQQKVVVGGALVTVPGVLVVISPTAGVDIASKEALFRTLTSYPDLAVLVVSDELDELSHCHRVLVMRDGRVSGEFPSWSDTELVAAMEGVTEQ
jgi:simple sugar transport system ATP-binding protein